MYSTIRAFGAPECLPSGRKRWQYAAAAPEQDSALWTPTTGCASPVRIARMPPQFLSASSDLVELSDSQLLRLRAEVEAEMLRRGKAFSVGELGEAMAIEYFRITAGLPILQKAPAGTKNVDCLSREGDRYSVKTICRAKKTGTIYPDADREKQLFEYLLIVRLTAHYELAAIYRFSWKLFTTLRSWDKRMAAWYVGASSKTLALAEIVHVSSGQTATLVGAPTTSVKSSE